MKPIVFATNNIHKLKEVRQILSGIAEVISLADIECFEDIPETGNTIDENAIQKAEYIFNKYHISCFADDTGLEVEALNMQPGVFSARYAGETKDPNKNILKLWEELKPHENKKARFRTIIALIDDQGIHKFEGIVNGKIIFEKRGENGFGYDPIFVPDNYFKTFAEMNEEEKNKISHRGLAIQKLLNYMNSITK